MSDLIRERSLDLNDFSGGLNNFWDASSISENEVPALLNMEFSPNGALTSRPPIVDSGLDSPVEGEYVDIIGFYMPAGGRRYIVAVSDSKTWVKDTDTDTDWIEVWASRATSFVQYDDEAVFSKATTGGRRWTAEDGGENIATMPALDGLLVFRDRFFGFGVPDTDGQTKLYFSDIITLAEPEGVWTWNVDSVINIGRGDGQRITGMIADYSKIIIFKSNSTYSLTYSALVEEGTVSLIQQGIGAENKECIASYQNGYLVLHDQTLYKFMNDNFSPLNAQKVSFQVVEKAPPWKKSFVVSTLGDRATVWFSGNFYTLNLVTGTWSNWQSEYSDLAKLVQRPRFADEIEQYELAYGISGSDEASKHRIYTVEDRPISSFGSESFTCFMRTKIYDLGTPAEWKRLYWWALDLSAKGPVTAKAYIVSLTSLIATYDLMSQTTWDAISINTWDRPLDGDAVVSTDREIISGVPQRALIKMDESLRFRRIYFEVYLECEGTAETAPAQIFSINPMVGIKAKMRSGVN